MDLTNRIRELRFKNGEMTQKRLAERVGISRQTMNAIENGRHAPTVDVAIRIADVFCVMVDELFDFHYDGKPEHRETAAPIAVDRSEVAARDPVEIEAEDDPVDEAARQKMMLASLRDMIG